MSGAARPAPPSAPIQFLALERNELNACCVEAKIVYQIEEAGPVRLRIYDLLGRHVETLVDATLDPGTYAVTLSGHPLVSGVYLYRLETPSGTESRRMKLVR